MAITATTIASAMTATDQYVVLTSATNLTNAMWIRVDDEFMKIRTDYGTGAFTGTTVPVVRRGDLGTQQQAHSVLATASFGLYTDLAGPASAQMASLNSPSTALGYEQISVGANTTTIQSFTRNTIIALTKATALASTNLQAPGKDQDGLTLILTSTTAAGHVVTATTLINDGVAGAPHSTLTFAAQKGASIMLVALAGLWQVVSNNNVTVS